jgi:hypothetical protein
MANSKRGQKRRIESLKTRVKVLKSAAKSVAKAELAES